MASCRVKTKQVGTVDASKVGVKRKIDITAEELIAFIKTVNVRPAPPVGAAEETKGVDLTQPFMGDCGEYIWPRNAVYPPKLEEVLRMCRDLFELKKEVKDFAIRIFPPAQKLNPHHTTTISRLRSEAALSIAARIIITVGSNEMLELHAQAAGHEGSGKMKLFDGYGLMLPIGMPAGIDITFDDSSSSPEPHRDGFRDHIMKKYPLYRWILVVDGFSDTDILINAVKDHAIKLQPGNKEAADKIAAQLQTALDLKSEVDAVAAAASAAAATEVADPIPQLVASP